MICSLGSGSEGANATIIPAVESGTGTSNNMQSY